MDLSRLAEPPVLADSFDPGSIARAGHGLVDAVGPVEVTQQTAHRVAAHAEVQGTAVRPYLVQVEAMCDPGWTGEVVVETWCSCPVRSQCKHGVAVCLRLADQPGPVDPQDAAGPPTWRDDLGALLRDLSPLDAGAPGSPLALRFTLCGGGGPRPTTAGATSTVGLRPMRRGKRGWAQTGMDWRDLPRASASRTHHAAQLSAITHLEAAAPRAAYWPGRGERSLAEFDSRLVDLLRAARDAGVELYGERPLTGVRVLDEPVALGLDLARDGDQVRVTVGFDLGEGQRPAPEVMLIGAPAHCAGAIDGAGRLVLAPLVPTVEAPLARTLRGVGSVSVPAHETEALDDYLQRLGRVLKVHSGDASVAVPAPVPPRLRVVVAWRSGDGGAPTADVRWSWVYDVPDGERACSLDADDRLGGLRDTLAERRLRRRVTEASDDGTPARDLSDRTVEGADLVGLALLEIPDWRSCDDVEVVERDRPDLRPAQERPTVSFELDEPTPRPSRPSGRNTEATDWLDLRVVVELHGEQIPLPDLIAALTRGDQWLLLPSGVYLATDLPEIAALLEAVRGAAELHDPRRDGEVRVDPRDLGTLAQISDVGRVDPGAAAWVERARTLRDLETLPRPETAGVVTELRPYQHDGFAWLCFLHAHGLGGVLADDMGLGKTLQVLALVARTRADGHTTPFLVVAPTSVVGAWASEAARHTPGLRVRTVSGTSSRRDESVAELAADADVVVTSYTLLRLESSAYTEVEWGGLVLDEAHQVKNHRSQLYAAVRPVHAGFTLAVTGTPFENRLMELWSLLSLVAPGLYPHRTRFAREVAGPVERHGDEQVLAGLRRRLRPFLLRRTKELVAADLPPKQEQVLAVELSATHRALYEAHLARERQRILGLLADFDDNRIEILAALTRLRMLALDPGLLDPEHDTVGSAKLDLLHEQLDEVTAEGHRVLVFSSFTSYLARLRQRLDAAGIAHCYLDGSTTDRPGVIDSFRSGDAPVFVISLKAGGVGLTLTEADYVYVLDPWWNPATEAQAVDRAHRIGQERTVMVYRLVSAGTIEEKVMDLKARKAEVFARVMDAGGAAAGEITAADIRGLFD